jgi:hypothetical protein
MARHAAGETLWPIRLPERDHRTVTTAGEAMTGQPNSAEGLSFQRDIRPMFREKDRESMLKAFDLWSHSDVQEHQDAILERVSNGTMPCDGAWPPERVAVFQGWIANGSAP